MEGAAPEAASIFNTIQLFIVKGGPFMMVILLVWAVGGAIAMERFAKLKKYDVDGASFMNEIQRYVLGNDIQSALRACSGSSGVLAEVLKAGLKRADEGLEQIQNALDASALKYIPRVELRLGYLQLVANISTLFGLLGTISGLIKSFAAVAEADPASRAEVLSGGIAQAMNTTALGLVAAISIMILHSIISAKAEKIVGEIDEYSVTLMDLLGTKKVADK